MVVAEQWRRRECDDEENKTEDMNPISETSDARSEIGYERLNAAYRE